MKPTTLLEDIGKERTGVQSLSTVEVCLKRRTQFLCSLTLVMQTTASLSSRGFASESTSTVGLVSVRTAEHTELLVSNDCWVVCINENYFVELVLTVLSDPVRVQDFHVREMTCNTLFSHTLRVLCHGDLLDTGLTWLALHVNLTLTKSTTADASSDHDNALLCLVTKATCSVDSSWAVNLAIHRFATPLSHTGLAEHVRRSLFWLLPSFTNMLIQSPSHNEHLRFSASCRLNSPL
jgi:hypothetical protein